MAALKGSIGSAGIGIVGLLLSSCTADRPAAHQVHAEAQALLQHMASNPQLVGEPERVNPDGSISHLVASEAPRFSTFSPHMTTWLDDFMEEEVALMKLGTEAIPTILSRFENRRSPRDLRARLALLLGRIGAKEAVPALLKAIQEEEDPGVRKAAYTGLGLLRDPEAAAQLRGVSPRSPSEARSVSWVSAMADSASATEQFLRMVEGALDSEVLEDITTGLSVPKIMPTEEGKELYYRAKESPGNTDLDVDLWRASYFPSPRTIGMLVRSLRYHEPHVQHMALQMLRRYIDDPLTEKEPQDYDLHVLAVYRAWASWWDLNGSTLRWQQSVGKFRSVQ